MNIALWIVAGMLAAMFLIAGAVKVAVPKERLETTIMVWAKAWSRPQLQVLGALEVLGAIGLILPQALDIEPVLTPVAAVCCALVMIGAAVTHTRMKDYKGIGMPVVLLILAAVVAVGRS